MKLGPLNWIRPSSKIFVMTVPRGTSFVDQLFYLGLVFVKLLRLFIAALWSSAGKGLTSWLLFVMFSCAFVTFPCGILGQVWYVTVLITYLCRRCYFKVAVTLESFPVIWISLPLCILWGCFKQSITVKDVPHVNIYSALSSMDVNVLRD